MGFLVSVFASPKMFLKSSYYFSVCCGSDSRLLPLDFIMSPEPTPLQSALSFPESALLVVLSDFFSFTPEEVCLSDLIFVSRLAVLLLLVSVSVQSSKSISLGLLGYFARLPCSPSFWVVLSSLKIPPPLLGPVPGQNLSSSKEWVDDPVTSQI